MRIKRLFDRLAGRQGPEPFIRYAITDPAIAAGVRDWFARYKVAEAAIDTHLKKIMPLQMRIDNLHYMTDLDGRLSAITVCGPVPHGWTGIKHVSLLRPESEEAVAAIDRLPKASRRDLNNLVGWPVFEEDYVSNKYPELARWSNYCLRAEEQDGQVFIAVSNHLFMREACPYIYAAIERWTQEQKILDRSCHMPAGNRPPSV